MIIDPDHLRVSFFGDHRDQESDATTSFIPICILVANQLYSFLLTKEKVENHT